MLRDKLNQVLATKRSFIHDPIVFTSIGISLLVNIIHLLVLYSNIKPNSTEILIQYNVVYGPRLVEKSLYIYGIPFLALFILVINFLLAARFYYKEKLAAYFLGVASSIIQLIFLAATLALIIANE